MSKIFSGQTLGKFEDAAASVPLRQLVRAFESADIRMGDDPGGIEGARRTQFRRYVAGVDQHDSRQLQRLGDALGALLAEVATSKVDFLVNAAKGDGFVFAAGVFRRAPSGGRSSGGKQGDALANVDENVERLQLLAQNQAADAVHAASELVESVCRNVLRLLAAPAPKASAGLDAIVSSTLKLLELRPGRDSDAKANALLVRRSLAQLSAVVASLEDLHAVGSHEARLAVDVAVAFARFVTQTYAERTTP